MNSINNIVPNNNEKSVKEDMLVVTKTDTSGKNNIRK